MMSTSVACKCILFHCLCWLLFSGLLSRLSKKKKKKIYYNHNPLSGGEVHTACWLLVVESPENYHSLFSSFTICWSWSSNVWGCNKTDAWATKKETHCTYRLVLPLRTVVQWVTHEFAHTQVHLTLAEEHLWSTCWSLTPSITLHVYLVSNIYADCDNLYEYFFRHVSTTSCWGGEWQGLFVCLTWGNGGGYTSWQLSRVWREQGAPLRDSYIHCTTSNWDQPSTSSRSLSSGVTIVYS